LSDAQVSTLLFKLLRTGCQWRELECGTASFMAVYRRVQLWKRTSVIEGAYQRALQTYSKLSMHYAAYHYHYHVPPFHPSNSDKRRVIGQGHQIEASDSTAKRLSPIRVHIYFGCVY
jgi:hypothetical protein